MNKNKKLVNAFLVSTMLLSGMALNVSAVEDPTVVRLGGNTRVETSNVVSSTTYESADTVIIAGYNGEVDALTGTILASVHNAPLLLVSEKEEDFEKTEAEVKRLGAKNAILLGDEQVISKNIASKIEKIGLKVSRESGNDRFDTAVAVAKAAGKTHEHVFLTNDGRSGELADALAAGPVSGRDKDPILLTSQAKLPSQTLQAIKDLNVQRVTIIGQEGAVSAGVKDELEALGIKVGRVGGKNRWETAELIAENYFGESKKVIVTNDGRRSYADALVGGYLGAKENAPVLLTQVNKLNDSTKNFLGSNATFAYVLGGETVVSKAVLTSVEEIAIENIEDELEAEEQAAIIKATEAVEKAEEVKGNYEVVVARKLVDALPESAIKTELTERLDAVEAERKADRAAVVEAIEDLSADSFELVGADKEAATIKLKGDHPNGSTYEFAGAGSGFFGYTINDDGVVIEKRHYEDKDLYFTFFVKAKKGTAGQHSGNFSVSIPGSDLIGTNRGTIIVKDSFDEVLATRVDQSIQDLPAADEITLKDNEVVNATRAAYDKLSKKQKELVTELEKLETVEAALAAANEAAFEVATTAVEKAEAVTVEKVETGEARENLKAAEKLVTKLLDNKEKDALVKRLTAAELAIEEIEAGLAAKQALAAATDAVEKAEKSALLVDFNAAQLLVDELINSDAKTDLQNRLDQIEVNLTLEEKLIEAEKELAKAEDDLEREEWIDSVHGNNYENVQRARKEVEDLQDLIKNLKQEIVDRDEAEFVAAEKAAGDATDALWGYVGNINQENKEEALKRLDEVEALVHKALDLGSEKELQEAFDYAAGFIRENIEKVETEAAEAATAAVVKAEEVTVEKVETGEARENMEAAEALVEALKEGDTKTSLAKRLVATELAIEEIEAGLEAKQKLADATQLVVAAEDWLSTENYEKAQLDYNAAVPAVEALIASDAKDELTQRLEDIKIALDQAASNAMVSKLTVSEMDKDRWSVDIAFTELELADLDTLTVTLFAGDREIAKHEATKVTLALEESTVVSPFYFTSENQATVSEYWTVVDTLKTGLADRAIITFTIGESTHTVNSADIK